MICALIMRRFPLSAIPHCCDSYWQSGLACVRWAVMRRVRQFVALTFLLGCCVVIGAEPARLPPDQLAKAIRNDSISIPTPGELFAALEKPGKPNWVGQMRGPNATTYKNRPQIALNLGSLIADGFIAVEAKDSQQVKNIGTDIIKLAKALGVR